MIPAMNAERLHAIVEILKAEVKDTNYPDCIRKSEKYSLQSKS